MKKDIIITALLTFCLTATLFMAATTRSQEYDPWADLNGDGKIDILDVVGTTGIYGASGDPTKNVTIAGRASKLAYYVIGQPIPATSWFTSAPIKVDGYSKISISILFTEPQFDYYLWSGISSSSFRFCADQGDETTFTPINCKIYDVMNAYIEIRVRNPEAYEAWLDVAVYLIP